MVEVLKSSALAAESRYTDEVKSNLIGNTFFYNGGDDTTLNSMAFDNDKATVSSVYIDGNGVHNGGGYECDYSIDDGSITLEKKDKSEMKIPYALTGEGITIDSGKYLSLDEVDAGIQGAWSTGVRVDYVLGEKAVTQYDIVFADGTMSYQDGSNSIYSSDEYFYSVKEPVTYTLGLGTIETEREQGANRKWFFNIIDGKPVILYFANVCHRVDRMPDITAYEALCNY
ncbi:MAG: hypothetical protein K5767_08585 [Clostridia bacterium]|nr:hypothetical protein [Clostridia bacterium]